MLTSLGSRTAVRKSSTAAGGAYDIRALISIIEAASREIRDALLFYSAAAVTITIHWEPRVFILLRKVLFEAAGPKLEGDRRKYIFEIESAIDVRLPQVFVIPGTELLADN